MRHKLALALLAAGAAVPATAATRDFPVGGFDRIASAGPFDVKVHVGGAPGVRAEGPQEVLDRLKIEVRNGRLWIGTKPGSWSFGGWHWFGHQQKTVINVVAPTLSGASISGPGDMWIDHARARTFDASIAGPGDMKIGMLETVDAHFEISGPGNITVAGHASRSQMEVSGPGDIHAKDFVSLELGVNVSGPGGITTHAVHSASGNVSGPGDVHIGGTTNCSIRKSGPGTVRCG